MVNGLTAQQLTRLSSEMQNLSGRVLEALIELRPSVHDTERIVAHVRRDNYGDPLLYMGLTSEEVRVLALPPPPPPIQDAIEGN